MDISQNEAYIAVRNDGFVDGACFTESAEAKAWCKEMFLAGFVVKVCDRTRAKALLFEFIKKDEFQAMQDAEIDPSFDPAYSCRVAYKGPSIGRYMNRDIPEWIITGDGTMHTYAGITGQEVDLKSLKDGQSVIAPGLLYERKGA